MNIKKLNEIKINECLLSLEMKDDILIIRISGQLDTYNSIQFKKNIETILSQTKFRKIIFNMKNLNYVSSTGISTFIEILRIFNKDTNPGEIVLSEIVPKVNKIFELLGFNSFFKIFDTMQYAIKYFENYKDESIFPRVLLCPFCNTRLKAHKLGKFRCKKCKSIVIIDSEGKIFKG